MYVRGAPVLGCSTSQPAHIYGRDARADVMRLFFPPTPEPGQVCSTPLQLQGRFSVFRLWPLACTRTFWAIAVSGDRTGVAGVRGVVW